MEHVFQVTGMTCGHCERAVRQALEAVDAASTIAIDRSAGRVSVQSAQASREVLVKAIEDAGYTVT